VVVFVRYIGEGRRLPAEDVLPADRADHRERIPSCHREVRDEL
jgi:hypothetical protein